MASVKFYYGATRPTASSTYEGTLFFNTGNKQISRCYSYDNSGTPAYDWENYGGEVVVLTGSDDFPTSGQREGVLYIKASSGAAKIYDGSAWVAISSGAIDIANPAESTPSNNSGKVVALGSDGKIPDAFIPHIALSEYISGTYADIAAVATAFTNETASGELGDYVITSDGKTYILYTGDGKSSSDWKELKAVDTNTWRKIKVDGTEKLGSATSTGDVNFASGSNVTITESSGTITIAAKDTTCAAGTAISVSTSNDVSTIGVKLASGSALTTDSSGNLEIEWQTYTPS